MLRAILVIDDYNELIYLQTLLKKLGLDIDGVQSQKNYADVSLGFNPHIVIATAKGKNVDCLTLGQSIQKKNGLPKIIGLRSSDVILDPTALERSGIDECLDSPVNPKKLILAISQLGGLDENVMLEKYNKIKAFLNPGNDSEMRFSSVDEYGEPIENIKQTKKNLEELAKVVKGTSGDSNLAKTTLQPSAGLANSAQVPSQAQLEEPPMTINQSQHYVLPKNDEARAKRFAEWAKKVGPLANKSFSRETIREANKKIRAWPRVDDIQDIDNEKRKFVKALFKK